MRIKVSKSGTKRTSKVVESLGSHEDIAKMYPNEDPHTWAKEYAKKLTQEEKENSHKIIAKYSPTKQIPLHKRTLFNARYLFLQTIYHEIKLNQVCVHIS